MKLLPYFVMAALVVVALAVAVFGGGAFWILPAVAIPTVAVYAVFDRRQKARESRGERLSADFDAGNA